MNRFKRIATRGWLNKALSILTFGYYPTTPYAVDVGPVDWCTAVQALYDWSLTVAALADWSVSASALYAWSVSSSTVYDWTVSAEPITTWSYHIEVLSCG